MNNGGVGEGLVEQTSFIVGGGVPAPETKEKITENPTIALSVSNIDASVEWALSLLGLAQEASLDQFSDALKEYFRTTVPLRSLPGLSQHSRSISPAELTVKIFEGVQLHFFEEVFRDFMSYLLFPDFEKTTFEGLVEFIKQRYPTKGNEYVQVIAQFIFNFLNSHLVDFNNINSIINLINDFGFDFYNFLLERFEYSSDVNFSAEAKRSLWASSAESVVRAATFYAQNLQSGFGSASSLGQHFLYSWLQTLTYSSRPEIQALAELFPNSVQELRINVQFFFPEVGEESARNFFAFYVKCILDRVTLETCLQKIIDFKTNLSSFKRESIAVVFQTLLQVIAAGVYWYAKKEGRARLSGEGDGQFYFFKLVDFNNLSEYVAIVFEYLGIGQDSSKPSSVFNFSKEEANKILEVLRLFVRFLINNKRVVRDFLKASKSSSAGSVPAMAITEVEITPEKIELREDLLPLEIFESAELVLVNHGLATLFLYGNEERKCELYKINAWNPTRTEPGLADYYLGYLDNELIVVKRSNTDQTFRAKRFKNLRDSNSFCIPFSEQTHLYFKVVQNEELTYLEELDPDVVQGNRLPISWELQLLPENINLGINAYEQTIGVVEVYLEDGASITLPVMRHCLQNGGNIFYAVFQNHFFRVEELNPTQGFAIVTDGYESIESMCEAYAIKISFDPYEVKFLELSKLGESTGFMLLVEDHGRTYYTLDIKLVKAPFKKGKEYVFEVKLESGFSYQIKTFKEGEMFKIVKITLLTQEM